MAPRLSFSDFVEYVLVRLYDLDNGEFVDVNDIAAELKESVPSAWPYEAVEYLDQRGYVTEALTFGAAHAMIKGSGRLRVEQREREPQSVAQRYRTEPQTIVVVSGSGNQIAIGNQGAVTQAAQPAPNEVVQQLLLEIEEVLQGADLSETDKQEYLADVATARTQLEKREPNRAAIRAVLTPLAQIAAVATPVLTILKLLGVG